MAAAEPRRPPPAHTQGPYKELLLGIFEDMDNGEFQSFKHRLDCIVSSDNVSIPKWRIMRANRLKMPDLILKYIPRREALEVVARILRDLPNVQLLERIQQFTHPEPGNIQTPEQTARYIVMRVKHVAATPEEYRAQCERLVELWEGFDPLFGNLILDEVRRQECVLVKYLFYMKELTLKRPADIIQKMASEECKRELRRLGVIYMTVEDATLFTEELHSNPRTWDPVDVNQWVARTLLPRDQTATIPDLQMTGAEICARPETWFTDKFPPGIGRVLYSDLQERMSRQRRFGGRQEDYGRVVESTSASFLISAYLISMILLLLGQLEGKAEKILCYLWTLIEIIERRADEKENIHSGHFKSSWATHNILKESSSLSSSVVFGSRAIAICSKAYSQVVTSVAEAMQVIGAPLEIKITLPWWKCLAVATVVAVGATVAFVIAGPLAMVIGGIILVAAIFRANQFLVAAFDDLMISEKKTAVFKVNYLEALILLPKVVEEEEMTEEKLRRIQHWVKGESDYKTIREVERDAVKTVYRVSSLGPGAVPSTTQLFNYKAEKWLHHDSIHNINDTMIIAHAHFELRRLLREVFVLGVVGSEHSGKTTLIKSVLPLGEQTASQSTTGPYDVKLYDGSNELKEETLPVLAFPSGPGKEVDAAHGLCVGICTAFICVVECNMTGSPGPDIRSLARVAHLSVPVLLCVNKCGGVNKRLASQILDRYKSAVRMEFEGLSSHTEVVLTDFHTTGHRPGWLTGAEGVKYWILDAIQNHKRYVRNAEAELQVFERELSF